MSANCCTNIHNLGCIECGDAAITLPVSATVTGTYHAFFRYLARVIEFEFEGVEGEPLTVMVSGLNENYRFSFYVKDPNGATVTYGAYDCFGLRVEPCVIDGTEPEPDGPCDPVLLLDEDDETVATLPAGTSYHLVDQNGDPVSVTLVGSNLVINMPQAIIPFANAAAASAVTGDPATNNPLTTSQTLRLLDSGYEYSGNGTSTNTQLIAAKKYHFPVTERPKGWNVNLLGTDGSLQINEVLP